MAEFYIALFFLFSFLGWILDSGYRSLMRRRFIRSGYFPAPLCPVYGWGGLALTVVFQATSSWGVFPRIILAWFVTVGVEFVCGVLVVAVLKVHLWNYSKIRGNIMGHISPYHSVGWLFVTYGFFRVVFPFVEQIKGYFHVEDILTRSDMLLFGTAIVLAGVATYLQRHYGPRHYCHITGH